MAKSSSKDSSGGKQAQNANGVLSVDSFLMSAKQTTGIASINKTQLSGFPVLLPPLSVQLAFLNRVERWKNEQQKLGNLERESSDLFGSLTQRAFWREL
ncbi:hypothetical protein [Candidatus Magnetaquiglobus chichijimensis]|uniref:hypothetical protein n=1 Tax=Candidatus Magnetaquiglobus chichijimensis TaxID=3141448 RepID=UPI003B9789AD